MMMVMMVMTMMMIMMLMMVMMIMVHTSGLGSRLVRGLGSRFFSLAHDHG